jgi:hypothetical protein
MSATPELTRRAWLAQMTKSMAGTFTALAFAPTWAEAASDATGAASSAPIAATLYKDPSCGCCTKWGDHLRGNGFAVTARDRSDMDTLKDSLGVPAALRSCHTAIVGKYVVEGHVPANDVKKLLASAPKDVVGIAVPGMPTGSPGMEGGRVDKYDVVAFLAGGRTRVFARH